ncbi:aprataxin and PNK-like factor [Sceloporus undulatus]|uniref:aprataxin and PNK-like factor n=1 Tax=Sceloporus undulatus TaxID=8520 RepID=UPI001C4B8693|nr:aprataxin and PNK-like factor [Sceloporus undulatus]
MIQFLYLGFQAEVEIKVEVHVNPCFYQPTENSELLPLDIDKWHQLSPGDSFSLLIDKYAFRVLFTPLDMEAQRKNCHLHVEDRLNQASSVLQPTRMPHSQPTVQQAASSKRSQLLDTHTLQEKAAEIPKESFASIPEIKESQPAERKRVLPAWMLQEDLMVQSQSASISGRGRNLIHLLWTS